jgi:hypothetical protein
VGTGQFTANFIVPKDILYADSTTRGRVSAYITDGVADAAGYTLKVYVGGTDTSATPDNTGPTVSLYLNTRTFRSGDHVSDDPLLIADLVDSSGINTSVSGIGHRIEAWLNGSAQSIDITDQYTSTVDDFRRGTVQYVLRDLPYGKNSIRVRAWDAFNNSSTSETSFDVTSGDKLTISDVFNYPNPFSRLHLRSDKIGGSLNVTIRILWRDDWLKPFSNISGDLFIQFHGMGETTTVILANGVYLYC